MFYRGLHHVNRFYIQNYETKMKCYDHVVNVVRDCTGFMIKRGGTHALYITAIHLEIDVEQVLMPLFS